jgi:hypothetical protein
VAFSPSSHSRLTRRDLGRFGGGSLFDRIGRAVCQAGCLPRKELFEAWEIARRVRRLVRGGRVVDLCGGHGLLAHVMLLLDDSSPAAFVVDTCVPPSAAQVGRALVEEWPRLRDRVSFVERNLDEFALEPSDVVVSSHACGDLTDLVLRRAAAARATVAVLPCCHSMVRTGERAAEAERTGPTSIVLDGWMDRALATDAARALWLQGQGYRVRTQTIPQAITPKNRLLIGIPAG